jgi:hypothetical protein
MARYRRRRIGQTAHLGAHSAAEGEWAYMPTRGATERGYLQRKSQTRSCSKAKRVAAVRELTPSLW